MSYSYALLISLPYPTQTVINGKHVSVTSRSVDINNNKSMIAEGFANADGSLNAVKIASDCYGVAGACDNVTEKQQLRDTLTSFAGLLDYEGEPKESDLDNPTQPINFVVTKNAGRTKVDADKVEDVLARLSASLGQ